MNRTGLLLVGAAVAIVGYAVLYSGLSTLHPQITPSRQPVGVLASLNPFQSRAPTAQTGPGPGGKKK